MTTRKHYRAAAAEFRALLERETGAHARAALIASVEAMCRVFRADNPRFSRAQFLEACGVAVEEAAA